MAIAALMLTAARGAAGSAGRVGAHAQHAAGARAQPRRLAAAGEEAPGHCASTLPFGGHHRQSARLASGRTTLAWQDIEWAAANAPKAERASFRFGRLLFLAQAAVADGAQVASSSSAPDLRAPGGKKRKKASSEAQVRHHAGRARCVCRAGALGDAWNVATTRGAGVRVRLAGGARRFTR
eukprot:42545-Prymnesium_polylepis.1